MVVGKDLEKVERVIIEAWEICYWEKQERSESVVGKIKDGTTYTDEIHEV